MIKFDEDRQNQKLDELRKKEAEALAETMAQRYGTNYVSLSGIPIDNDGLRLIPEAVSREAGIAVFDSIGKKIKVAVISLQNEKTQAVLKELESKGYFSTIYIVTAESLKKAWDQYKDLSYASVSKEGAIEVSNEEIGRLAGEIKSLPDIITQVQSLIAEKKSYRISRILEVMLAGALSIGASDIHIEPEEDKVRLRYRLDGVLSDALFIDKPTYNLMISRIKLLSGLKLNVKDNSQDGRFSVNFSDINIEIRTSILPGAYGESVVLRVLNPKSIAVPLEALGIHPRLLSLIESEIKKPNGMILTTGPTGSGKTTTLYAFLRKIHNPEVKIITIEDPIEYHLPGIVQTQTDTEKGYTFLSGLRSALRQDPDIIMVGEIRDNETAEIAVNSALTGHLVFSTLHTNNAAGAFPRLIDLGVNPKVISSAINMALAQRLVRKLCDKCRKEILPEPSKKALLEKVVASIIDSKERLPVTNLFEPVGCEACNHTGYKGRLGIYEAILTDEAVEKVIVSNPSERELRKAALPQGILSMSQDGVLKVIRGVTTIEELERVIELGDE